MVQRNQPEAETEARQEEESCGLLQIERVLIKEGEGYDVGGEAKYRGVVL